MISVRRQMDNTPVQFFTALFVISINHATFSILLSEDESLPHSISQSVPVTEWQKQDKLLSSISDVITGQYSEVISTELHLLWINDIELPLDILFIVPHWKLRNLF